MNWCTEREAWTGKPLGGEYPWGMSPIGIVLLVAAAGLLVAVEWSRIRRPGAGTRRVAARSGWRERKRRRSRPKLEVVRPESEEFARSVERDLEALPMIDEHDVKRR
jgi:hypothetical protein